jgi:hypothetical protein
MIGQLTPVTIGFLLGILGSLAAAIVYDRVTRPKLTVLPDTNRALGQATGQAPHAFYHVLVRQVTPAWPLPGRKPAWDCKLTLDVIDIAGTSILPDGPILGRWASQPEPLLPTLQGSQLVNVIDFARFTTARKANVHSHEDQSVSVALKYEGSADCFLFSNESYLFPRWERPEWRLGPGDHRLRITLDYERGREVRHFVLRNVGTSRGDVLLETESPSRRSS